MHELIRTLLYSMITLRNPIWPPLPRILEDWQNNFKRVQIRYLQNRYRKTFKMTLDRIQWSNYHYNLTSGMPRDMQRILTSIVINRTRVENSSPITRPRRREDVRSQDLGRPPWSRAWTGNRPPIGKEYRTAAGTWSYYGCVWDTRWSRPRRD